ncbi:DUF397 domain-containing protein [Streptosporangium saharense]|uniref:Putative secreted Zn-dependent protease n=1 Tax=Streptosporangium saharense TaxID=1706840 RepID=A0A7W7QJA7_9ACTN|nr:DUF397 domain-containing protein [Streptosporangium saharense]MBB4914479.1 putative secreted Zn-dependent protease [Streptosporangium saharense]
MNTWRKSTLSSGDGGNCVEVANLGPLTTIRDSKNPTGPTLTFTATEWTSFIEGVKNGTFDTV